MINSCYLGDVRDGLRAMASAGVRARTCVTSPPYWGLRDYGVAGQLGLEPTPEEYVANMVEVFRLVRDVLADDGTLWLNMGDSYVVSRCGGETGNSTLGGSRDTQDQAKDAKRAMTASRRRDDAEIPRSDVRVLGLKPKDMCMMPARLAIALQADGWWLRQDIIWSKPNPMPESIRDRCTKAHEYLFLLSKRERYHFDAEAIAEPRSSAGGRFVTGWATDGTPHSAIAHARDKGDARSFRGGGKYTGGRAATPEMVERETRGSGPALADKRNRRSVWTIAAEPFPEAHFATFPTALVEPCVLAGSAIGDVVLDPFMGSGTVAQVAQALGRSWVGCELNPEYHAMIARRTRARGLALA